MKYIYNIGYGTYEESDYEQLTCDTLYTSQELETLINKIIKSLLLKANINDVGTVHIGDGNGGFINTLYGNDKNEKYSWHITFQNLFDNIKKVLIEEYKFERLHFNATYGIFGWGGFFDGGWEHDSGDTLNTIKEMVKSDVVLQNKQKELIEAAMPHLKRAEEELELFKVEDNKQLDEE